MKKFLLIMCITLFVVSVPRALYSMQNQIAPVGYPETLSNEPYCTYNRLYKCLERSYLNKSTGTCVTASYTRCDHCCNCIDWGLKHCTFFMIGLVSIPFFCIKDTICLPCDRNETPPQCYPWTKLNCYDLSCETCKECEN